jgi:hypothetical protein
MDLVHACGPSRHFTATQRLGRFWREADMNRQTRPVASIANDPISDIKCALQQSKVIFNRSLDHLVGHSEQRGGTCEAECLRGLGLTLVRSLAFMPRGRLP